MNRYKLGGWLIAGLLLCSCEEDHDPMPAYQQRLAELTTDVSGKGVSLSFDDGEVRQIQNSVSGLVSDTVYRILALYIENGNSVQLQAARSVISPLPIEANKIEIKTDPLELKALWRAPRYINFLVGVHTGGGEHTLGFINHGVESLPNGVNKLKLEVFHDQMDDTSFYTQETYLSCPLYPFAERLTAGKDSVEIKVQTWKGSITQSYLY